MNIRASQINGCGACLDMHTKEAAHAGETALRMNLVGTWRETTVFTDAERAALELTEQGTRLADTSGITDGRCRIARRCRLGAPCRTTTQHAVTVNSTGTVNFTSNGGSASCPAAGAGTAKTTRAFEFNSTPGVTITP